MPESASSSRLGTHVLLLAIVCLAAPSACTADTSATAPTPATRAAAPAPAPAAAAPADQDKPTPMAFDSDKMTIKGKEFGIEIAASEAQIERGLMFRDSMAPDHGMLFTMPNEDRWSFWMKNTRIPLDIIYLDKNGRVVDIHQRRPFDETGMTPRQPALFVIELNLGMAQKIGLQRGDVVEIPKKYLKSTTAPSDK